MEINFENYQAYLLDYFEQNLSPAQVAELMVFLEMHPELKAEFEGYEVIGLQPDHDIIYEPKDLLKKSTDENPHCITTENCEDYLIASVEGLLSRDEEQSLNLFLDQNPSFRKDAELFRLTVLKADKSVVFKDKDSLKHATAFVQKPSYLNKKVFYPLLAVAASLALLVGIYFSIGPRPDTKPLAEGKVKKSDTPAATVKDTSRLKGKPEKPARKASGGDYPLEHNFLPGSDPAVYAAAKRGEQNSTSGEITNHQGKDTQVGEHGKPTLSPEPLLFAQSLAPKSLTVESLATQGIFRENRNEFSEIYQFAMLRDRIDYAQYLSERENKPVWARVARQIKTGLFGEEEFSPAGSNERAEAMWAIAKIGVKGFNALTNSDVRLLRRQDDNGRILSYAVKSQRLEYSKDLVK